MSAAKTLDAPEDIAVFAKIPEPEPMSKINLFFAYLGIIDCKRYESSAGWYTSLIQIY